MYAIFSFEDENTVEAVPYSWCVDERSCFWPPARKQNDVKKLIQEGICPEQDWKVFKGKIIFKTELYSKAREHLNKSEITSDLASEAELGRGKRYKRRTFQQQVDDSDSQSEDGNETPIIKNAERKLMSLPKPPEFPLDKISDSNTDLVRRNASLSPGCRQKSRNNSVQEKTLVEHVNNSVKARKPMSLSKPPEFPLDKISDSNTYLVRRNASLSPDCRQKCTKSRNNSVQEKTLVEHVNNSVKATVINDRSQMDKSSLTQFSMRKSSLVKRKNTTSVKNKVPSKSVKTILNKSPTKETSSDIGSYVAKPKKNSEPPVIDSDSSEYSSEYCRISKNHLSNPVLSAVFPQRPPRRYSSYENNKNTTEYLTHHSDYVNLGNREYSRQNFPNSGFGTHDSVLDMTDQQFRKTTIFMLTDIKTKLDKILLYHIKDRSTSDNENLDVDGFPPLPIESLRDLQVAEDILANEDAKIKTVTI